MNRFATYLYQRKKSWKAVLVSVALHLAFLASSPLWLPSGRANSVLPNQERWQKIKLAPIEPEVPSLDKKIVDVLDQKSIVKTPLEDADFLSDENRAVKKQIKARVTSSSPGQAQTKNSSQEKKAKKQERKTNYALSLPNTFLEEIEEKQEQKSKNARAIASAKNYLPEISFGDETLLNTRQYAYASFFVRMKRQLEATWSPRAILQNFNTGKTTYVTELSIVLDDRGELIQTRIVQSSGNRKLDNEALRAVKQASPFLNPPKGIIEKNGKIHIPKWKFIVSRSAFL